MTLNRRWRNQPSKELSKQSNSRLAQGLTHIWLYSMKNSQGKAQTFKVAGDSLPPGPTINFAASRPVRSDQQPRAKRSNANISVFTDQSPRYHPVWKIRKVEISWDSPWKVEASKVAGFIRPCRIYSSTRHRVHFLNDDHGGDTFWIANRDVPVV
jgi:hypothetical protein